MSSTKLFTLTITSTILLSSVLSVPIKQSDRKEKSLNYYNDYSSLDRHHQPPTGDDLVVDYGGDSYDDVVVADYDYDENALSRTIPKRKKVRRPFDSPIYYIRLPPQPYMFVPGLGYMSQPPPPTANPMQQFLNVPVSFVSNGKPANIYQWSGLPQLAPPPPRPKPKPDSPIHRLPGQYTFNGKPEDIFILREDSYNSLFSDALQNFYP